MLSEVGERGIKLTHVDVHVVILIQYMFQQSDTLSPPDVLMQQERAERERELDYQPRKVKVKCVCAFVSIIVQHVCCNICVICTCAVCTVTNCVWGFMKHRSTAVGLGSFILGGWFGDSFVALTLHLFLKGESGERNRDSDRTEKSKNIQ